METKNKKSPQDSENKSQGWQQVVIGGISGIVMGAGGTLAAEAYAKNEEEQPVDETDTNNTDGTAHHTGANGVQVAEVDQSLSFGQAFAAARAEVGAGGVFEWHGQLYNTYYKEEWDNMSAQQKNEFAHQVQPEVAATASHAHHDTTDHTATQAHEEHAHEDQAHQQATENHQAGNHQAADNNNQSADNQQTDNNPSDNHQTADNHEVQNTPEVHYLGVEHVDDGEGHAINIGRMTIGDTQVALVDVDDDHVFDASITDINQNGEVDDGEVADISEAGITIEQFAEASAIEAEHAGYDPTLAVNNQDDIANDMPDYVNDADVTV